PPLRGSTWDRSTALDFIQHLPDDAPSLLDQLIDHTLSHRWALAARQASPQHGERAVCPNCCKR
ncbi:MAG TPA: hypothetical protein VHN18_15290, partial [Micromonosporaceae bacterium]|nr:hypothetical protein [Micromonosporaceae bacterium]